MIRESFRPWGRLDQILSQIGNNKWDVVAAVSSEDRSSAAMELLAQHGALKDTLIIRMADAESRFYEENERKSDIKERDFIRLGVNANDILRYQLLGRHGAPVQEILNFTNRPQVENLLFDISCLPKKLFFIAIRKLRECNATLKNIVVTYTEPGSYCDESLAENPEPWSPLPGFLPPRIEPSNKVLVISLGFEPLGLPELYSSGLFSNAKIRLLFPFPASPKSVARNWDFARLLEPVPGNAAQHIERLDARNVPDIFDRLEAITDFGQTYAILAPFGPKPMSLAMCLFASAYSTSPIVPSVFYTQPTVYNPNYSVGIRQLNQIPLINAYCIRLSGTNLYNPS